MFEHLSKHKVILVTGPNRSGTTIAARMIANDTGHDFVIEDEFGFSNLRQLSAFIHADYGPVVIQCPFLTHWITQMDRRIGLNYDDTLVVMMRRSLEDIQRSEKNAPVNFVSVGESQKRFYGVELSDYRDDHIATIKYRAWDRDKYEIPNHMDLEYDSLCGHPMWAEDRSKFKFQHQVTHRPLPKVFRDAIKQIQNI